jgi:hypothetical protein
MPDGEFGIIYHAALTLSFYSSILIIQNLKIITFLKCRGNYYEIDKYMHILILK